MSGVVYSEQSAALYASLGITGTTYQVGIDGLFSEITSLRGQKVLDFGCGAGRSTALLQSFSPATLIGVDHNATMIDEAKKVHGQEIKFLHVESTQALPFENDSFDSVFALHVYCEFNSVEQMGRATKEIHRVLKPDGRFFIITTSPDSIGAEYINFHHELPKTLHDGCKITCHIHTQPPFSIDDTWWSRQAMDGVFNSCRFEIIKALQPLADGKQWRDEKRVPPAIVYTLRPIK